MSEKQGNDESPDTQAEETPEAVEEATGEEAEAAVEEAPAEPTLEEQLQACEEKYLRVHADFENIKKRLEREKYQAIDYAQEKFATDLLPVIDTLRLALQTEDAAAFDKLKEGVELTLDKLVKVFEKHGIEEVSGDGEFDPHCHEAVMQVPSEEHDENHVVQVLQTGYQYKERILRPAMVSICKK